ncbi:hypothetical protein B0J14DRAFT_560916 [Halenospora varia]|nr:hypothetical protein B0J14DRAFT_560916 [Halenospora varia]
MEAPGSTPPARRAEGKDYLQGGQIASSFAGQYFQPGLSQSDVSSQPYRTPHQRASLPNEYFTPPPSAPTIPTLSRLNIPNLQGQQLEALYTEKCYLSNSLHEESTKGAELRKKISQLEASLSQNGPPPAQRKIKKQVGWLKHRYNETKKQESVIAARLHQLSIDISSEEGLKQIQMAKLQLQLQHAQFINASHQSTQDSMEQHVQLNPTSPIFQPRLSQSALPPTPLQSPVEWSPSLRMRQFEFGPSLHQKSLESHSSPIPEEDDYDAEISPTTPFFPSEQMLGSDLLEPTEKLGEKPRPLSFDNQKLDILSTNNSRHSIEIAKRYSVPTIPGLSKIWEFTREEEQAEGIDEADPPAYRIPRSRMNSVV